MKKLDSKEYSEYKALAAKVKANKCTPAEKVRYEELQAKRNEKGSNDLQWWSNYPELLKDVVNFPFNWIPGTTVHFSNDELKLGVMAIAKLAPGIGKSTNDASAFNTQIRQLWLDMHRKYRGIGTYEKADLGIALLAIASAFESLAKFERIYGVINTYKIGNRVIPNGLKDALGITNDLEENLADFRYTLNLYIEKMRQLCLPKGLDAIMADIVAISNIFADSSDRRAFLFGFDTEYFGWYSPTAASTGGCVLYADFAAGGFKNGVTPGNLPGYNLSDIQGCLEFVTSALLSDDDIARMCSDMLAAYGEGNVMSLNSVPDNYMITPVHDYERQVQFHNMTIVGKGGSIVEVSAISTSDLNNLHVTNGVRYVIYQSNNVIKCQVGKGQVGFVAVGTYSVPQFVTATDAGEMPVEKEVLFDTWVESPTATEIMCGTRYTSLGGVRVSIDSTHSRQEIDVFGTKLVETVEVFKYAGNGYYRSTINGSVFDETRFKNRLYDWLPMTQLDWRPTLYIIDSGDMELFGDIDNFTIISRNNLQRLHEVALLSGYKFDVTPKE